jgi:mRNA-degrading endonuclease RelE of RelBE toxin-antitoxin system
MYDFVFSSAAEKDFLELSQDSRIRILKKIRFFLEQENPLEYSKKLRGDINRYRFRIGDYRVIFSKKENGKLVVLLILKIAHRKKVYKK